MKITDKYWALAIDRIAKGEHKPGRLIERVTLNQSVKADEGAVIEHPRLGRVALYKSKQLLAEDAVERFRKHRTPVAAFMKQYGHWLNGGFKP